MILRVPHYRGCIDGRRYVWSPAWPWIGWGATASEAYTAWAEKNAGIPPMPLAHA